jgi:O-antigen ligase
MQTAVAPHPPPPAPSPGALPAAAPPAPRPRHALGFALFLLLNAVLFLRPAETIPALAGLEIYLVVILACLAASFPAVLEQFRPSELERRPITVCVLGLLLAIILSHLSHLDFGRAAEHGYFFFKFAVYYLLFVGLVDTPGRLRALLACLAAFTAAVAALTVLQYHGVIDLQNVSAVKDVARDAATGKDVTFLRLRFSGIFNDPNDLGVLLAAMMVLGLYWLFDRRSGLLRFLWAGPLLLFLYALGLTQSRGALLALAAGLGVFLVKRFGWLVALLLGAACLPLLLLFLSARQLAVETEDGTGQERIQTWSDGLATMKDAPLFGVGMEQFGEQTGHVAHNSYLHCFVEMGVFGGVLFLGTYYLALTDLFRLGRTRRRRIADGEMGRLQPYLLGTLAAYAVGMMSLTLCYILPTYTLLGAAAAFRRAAPTLPALPPTRFDLRLVGVLALVSAAGLAAMYVFVRLFLVR